MNRLWTEEMDAVLKRLWADGLSAAQIAAEMGDGRSRNSVIGRVHRLKLSSRAKPHASVPRPQRSKVRRTSANLRRLKELRTVDDTAPAADPLHFGEPLNGTGVPFLERGTFQCSWIVNDEGPMVCGHSFPEGSHFSWCKFHMEIGAVKPVRPQRRDGRRAPREVA